MIPKKCTMLDISQLKYPLKGSLILYHLICSDEGLSRNASSFIKLYIRLIDKTIYEYNMARTSTLEEVAQSQLPTDELIKNGQVIYIFSFWDHMENCINTLNRLFNLFNGLKSEKTIPEIPRFLRKKVESYNTSIRDFRHTIEHMEAKIKSGKFPPGKGIAPTINQTEDSIEISNHRITFIELFNTIKNMHEIGMILLKYYEDKINKKTEDGPSRFS